MTEHTLADGSTLTMMLPDGGATIDGEHPQVTLSPGVVAALSAPALAKAASDLACMKVERDGAIERGKLVLKHYHRSMAKGLDVAKLLEWLGDQSSRALTSMESAAYLDVAGHVRGTVSTLGKSNGWEDAALRAMSPLCEVSEPAPRVSEPIPEGWNVCLLPNSEYGIADHGPSMCWIDDDGLNVEHDEDKEGAQWVPLDVVRHVLSKSSPGTCRGEGSTHVGPGVLPNPSPAPADLGGGAGEVLSEPEGMSGLLHDVLEEVEAISYSHANVPMFSDERRVCSAYQVRSLVRRLMALYESPGPNEVADVLEEAKPEPDPSTLEAVRGRLFGEDRSEPPQGYFVEPLAQGVVAHRWGIVVDGEKFLVDTSACALPALKATRAHRAAVLASAQLERLRATPSGHEVARFVARVRSAVEAKPPVVELPPCGECDKWRAALDRQTEEHAENLSTWSGRFRELERDMAKVTEDRMVELAAADERICGLESERVHWRQKFDDEEYRAEKAEADLRCMTHERDQWAKGVYAREGLAKLAAAEERVREVTAQRDESRDTIKMERFKMERDLAREWSRLDALVRDWLEEG